MHKVVSGRCSKFPAVRRLQERIPARSRFTDPIRSALILSIDLLASFNPLPVTPSFPIGRAVLEQRPIWVHSLEETAQSFATFVPILREQKTALWPLCRLPGPARSSAASAGASSSRRHSQRVSAGSLCKSRKSTVAPWPSVPEQPCPGASHQSSGAKLRQARDCATAREDG